MEVWEKVSFFTRDMCLPSIPQLSFLPKHNLIHLFLFANRGDKIGVVEKEEQAVFHLNGMSKDKDCIENALL